MPPQIFHALKTREVRGPGDVSLKGFDDRELAEYSEPPLSTVAADKLGIGTEAAELARRCMRKEQTLPAGTCILPIRLI